MLEWIEEYSIGIEEIDNDHKVIIKLANEAFQILLAEKSSEIFKEKMKDFKIAVEGHLIREEVFMEEIGYPEINDHKLLHKEIIIKAKEIIDELIANTEGVSFILISKSIDFLKYYILDHLSSEDKKIGNFVNASKEELTIPNITEGEFYTSLEYFHQRVLSLQGLITEYFVSRKKICESNYLGIKIIDGKVKQTTFDLSNNCKERIEGWLKTADRREFYHSIYKIDLYDNVYLFKLFEFEKDKLVLAGYLIKDSVNVRLFLSTLSEKVIQERYEKVLAIL